MKSNLIPSLNWLRVFEAAARRQSFAKAAKDLNMSAAAVSQQILALETHLGKALFERTANRISLTVEGSDFLPTVQHALNSIESKAAAMFSRQRVERVTLRASQLMAMSWLPQVLATFETDHPNIQVELTVEDSMHPTAPDLTIRFGEEPHLLRHPGRLMGVSHIVLCRAQDVAKVQSPQDFENFRLLEVASHTMGWAAIINQNFGPTAGRHLSLKTIDTTPQALMMVAQGLGLAIGHIPVCNPLADALGLVTCPLVPATPGPGNYYLEYPKRQSPRPAVLKLEQALLEAGYHSMTDGKRFNPMVEDPLIRT